jgi:hypothetical protein
MTKAEEKRRSLRDQVFPNCTDELWNRKLVTGGFTTIPRTLGLIMTLIEQLADRKKGKDVSRTYFELWCRAFDDYFIDAGDVESLSFAAGFVTRGRNVRSWEERIQELGNLGFIRTAPNGTRKQGYVLLVDPHKVIKRLRANGQIGDEWWGAYTKRATDIGFVLP